MLDKKTPIRFKFTISRATLRYKRSVEVLNLDSAYRTEVLTFGRGEEVPAGVRQHGDLNIVASCQDSFRPRLCATHVGDRDCVRSEQAFSHKNLPGGSHSTDRRRNPRSTRCSSQRRSQIRSQNI